jgi:hypothetical protein
MDTRRLKSVSAFAERVRRDGKAQRRSWHNGYVAGLRGAQQSDNPHLLTYDVLAEQWAMGCARGQLDGRSNSD